MADPDRNDWEPATGRQIAWSWVLIIAGAVVFWLIMKANPADPSDMELPCEGYVPGEFVVPC